MSTEKKKRTPVTTKPGNLNLMKADSGYTVAPGVGPVVDYHGRTIDLRDCSKGQAKQMSEDQDCRWISAVAETKAADPVPAVAKK